MCFIWTFVSVLNVTLTHFRLPRCRNDSCMYLMYVIYVPIKKHCFSVWLHFLSSLSRKTINDVSRCLTHRERRRALTATGDTLSPSAWINGSTRATGCIESLTETRGGSTIATMLLPSVTAAPHDESSHWSRPLGDGG